MADAVDASADTLAGAAAGAGAAARTLADARRPAATPGVIGKHFAHFRVESEVGRGGMGEVYLATDLALDRPVAVKILPHGVAKDEQFRARFIREARAQARIMHPHICHIYFIGEQDEQLFFAMELVDGENLQKRLERLGKLPVAESIEIITQAARGLREAERHGFIHRDIKPSNLLVDRNGVVKLVDFGLVKSATARDGSETERGEAIVGTPLYIAPEQARGDPVDFRADMYGLGVTLHHLVTGKPPFSGETPLAIVSKHLSDPRPLIEASRRGTLLDTLLDRMMAKRPGDRFASYDELLDALADLAPDRTRPAGVTPRAIALGLDLLLVGAVAALIAGGLRYLGVSIQVFPILAALYGILLPARNGRTIGKTALEIEVRAGGRRGGVGLGRAVRRFAVEWAPTYFFLYAAAIGEAVFAKGTVIEVTGWVLVGIGLAYPVLFGIFAVRSEGKRTIWDRLSGTRVVYQ